MKSLLKLKPYLRPYLWLIIASAALAIPLSALRLSPAPLVKYIVDDLLVNRDSSKLLIFPAFVILLYTLNFIIRFAHYYLMRIVIARVNQRIKNELHEHLVGLSADYFTSQSTGTLISRVGTDPQYIDMAVLAINTLIREPLYFVSLLGYAFYLNWRLTLMTIVVLPPLAWVFSRTGKNMKRYMAGMTEENARIFSQLQETFTGIRVIKTFQLEKYARKKFRERTDQFLRLSLKNAKLEEASHPMVELLTAFAIAGIIYYGGAQILKGSMTAGDLQAFFVTFALMMNPTRSFNEINIKLNQASAAAERVFEIFSWKSRLHESARPLAVKSFNQSIEIKNVSFAYPDSPQRNVLKNVSFTLRRGEVLALVGASGSGKSSLVSLLPRIFDITQGNILIDGHDVRELALSDLRQLISVVSQDVFLFNDTIEENIRCGKLSATREQIEEAARRAHALDFIQTLPDRMNSIVGDRGQKLSGGERQRISIARAFLREAPILILDEATSSLDTASERAVQSALDELMQNRTTLVIAHRLSTIRHADQIMVLKDGEIVERGRHEELVRMGGEYARFHGSGGVAQAP